MSSLNRLTLVLNASYEPVNVCTARRALILVIKEAAVIEEVSTCKVHTSKRDILVPSVIRLLKYRRIPRQLRAVSRKGILLRDHSTCQYCGAKKDSGRLTMDHVIPRSRGGESSWVNLVASCFECNNLKGDRTPEEAGMVLAKQPRQISIHAKHRLLVGDEGTWEKYLFC